MALFGGCPMDDRWQGLTNDFSDLPGVVPVVRVGIRLALAAVLGGMLGYERERAGKDAGMRTHMLVSLGAALFIVAPQVSGMDSAGISRVLQGLVAGIGFIGAGATLKLRDEQRVRGLTTAAGLWLTAAFGTAAGLGRLGLAILGTLLALAILVVVRWLENRIEGDRKRRQIVTNTDATHREKAAGPPQ
jgi:putative Mg2+ transporter-C (MgtC) family protein